VTTKSPDLVPATTVDLDESLDVRLPLRLRALFWVSDLAENGTEACEHQADKCSDCLSQEAGW
jgi:hypothetical protein